jgi:hypothetical protein
MGRSQTRRAARQPAPAPRVEAYRAIGSLVRTLDGLQPDKGHETLSVGRELRRKRGWCAAPLWSSAPPAVRRWSSLARQWAAPWAKPGRAGMSDTPDACVTAMADECVGVPHRYGHPHCRRDMAQPVLDLDRPAQGKRRRTGRGRRASARRVLAERRQAAAAAPPLPQGSPQGDAALRIDPSEAAPAAPGAPGACGLATPGHAPVEAEAGEVGRGDGAAVRGMLHDSPGGPRRSPG